MNAHTVRFSLYFSLIQGYARRDELATDCPLRHISTGCELSSELPFRSTLPGIDVPVEPLRGLTKFILTREVRPVKDWSGLTNEESTRSTP